MIGHCPFSAEEGLSPPGRGWFQSWTDKLCLILEETFSGESFHMGMQLFYLFYRRVEPSLYLGLLCSQWVGFRHDLAVPELHSRAKGEPGQQKADPPPSQKLSVWCISHAESRAAGPAPACRSCVTRECLDFVQATGSVPSDIRKYNGMTSPKAVRE